MPCLTLRTERETKLGGSGRVQLCSLPPNLRYQRASTNHKDSDFSWEEKRNFEICLVNSSPFYEKGQVAQDLQKTFSKMDFKNPINSKSRIHIQDKKARIFNKHNMQSCRTCYTLGQSFFQHGAKRNPVIPSPPFYYLSREVGKGGTRNGTKATIPSERRTH